MKKALLILLFVGAGAAVLSAQSDFSGLGGADKPFIIAKGGWSDQDKKAVKGGLYQGGKSGGAAKSLSVWSFLDELNQMINGGKDLPKDKSYMGTHPGAALTYKVIPTDFFSRDLDGVLASGKDAPDVFTLESSFVRKYVESGLLLDITDIYEANKDKLLAYPAQVGSYEGKVYALSLEVSPGALFYRRSLAKKYLGTDDPVQVQAAVADFDVFLKTAETLKQKSGGSCVIVASVYDILPAFSAMRQGPFVVDNTLVIDPAIERFFDYAKTMYEKGYEGEIGPWSFSWFDGMRGGVRDGRSGEAREVFSYFFPDWGLKYVLMANAWNTSGDWAVVPGPAPYRWGGTWIAANKNAKDAGGAKEFIRYLTTDDGFMEAWARGKKDLSSNTAVNEKIKDLFAEAYLGGQNHYAVFAEIAKKVNSNFEQSTDELIESIMMEQLIAYIWGEKTKQEAFADWREASALRLGLD